jgi:hypothetical protein
VSCLHQRWLCFCASDNAKGCDGCSCEARGCCVPLNCAPLYCALPSCALPSCAPLCYVSCCWQEPWELENSRALCLCSGASPPSPGLSCYNSDALSDMSSSSLLRLFDEMFRRRSVVFGPMAS